jgi:hypothetical protein
LCRCSCLDYIVAVISDCSNLMLYMVKVWKIVILQKIRTNPERFWNVSFDILEDSCTKDGWGSQSEKSIGAIMKILNH